MARAFQAARAQLGLVWPNPAVGCVVVHQGVVVGEGATQAGGRPHAEVVALSRAGRATRGATAYVSLEPCDHVGRTPPCTTALLDAEVARVVVATIDPDPRVCGRGIARLRGAGIEVEMGIGEAEANEINAGFVSRIVRGRPLVAIGPRGLDAPLDYDAVLHTLAGSGPLHGVTAGAQLRLNVEWSPDGVDALLRALGKEGLTRVVVPGDDPLAEALTASGRVDRVEPGR